ncbi:transposase [Deinococcus cellulosilyticus]|uniref:Transposase n=1 Tax=Deinococcus cellulosilyticus (strain DSM 18568 / NBRC 106333 / KACC 11606 / 5516J-15) TaxID=1223518 RepID=A0A511NCA7_DEIC1|nr:transposase [Deinococcus cellulosilyticus]GEM50138.1 hypothetical protein DC3_57730 [Deinococcus cellulosilyticus NBRC 106333 = KACC 11606]
MGKQRKNWPADLKQTIVLEVLKGEESVASIARRYEVSEPLVYKWKEQFLQGGMNALSNKNESPSAALQNENDRLKRLLAEKELALDIAKKIRGL